MKCEDEYKDGRELTDSSRMDDGFSSCKLVPCQPSLDFLALLPAGWHGELSLIAHMCQSKTSDVVDLKLKKKIELIFLDKPFAVSRM